MEGPIEEQADFQTRMIQIRRKPIPYLLRTGRTMLLAAAMALTLAACSAAPVARTEGLDPRLAWPCDRLVLVWTVDEPRLQQMLGEALEVRRIAGAGQLHLHLMRCEPPGTAARNAQALTYAYVLIPVSGDSAPIAITRIPAEGWLFLQYAVAGAQSPALFADLGYRLIVAAQDFTIHATNGVASFSAQLTFDNGSISIEGKSTAGPLARVASTALLASGDGYVSAFFGDEASQRYAAYATVRIAGETPLPVPPDAQALAILDRRLVSNRVYWRIPTP